MNEPSANQDRNCHVRFTLGGSAEIRAFHLHKAGLQSDQYEDAWDWKFDDGASQACVHIAIADGATDAMFSGRWARLLVEQYVQRPRQRLRSSWLAPASKTLRQSFDIGSLPWYAQEKAGRGAFATLFGLSIDLQRRQFRTVSVGDSCLAIVHENGHVEVVPPVFSDPAAFGNTPPLLSSNPLFNEQLIDDQKTFRRVLRRRQTTFLLMTDALAAWFSASLQRDGVPWKTLVTIENNDAFAAFVGQRRASGEMRNDDVTLVHLRLVYQTED